MDLYVFLLSAIGMVIVGGIVLALIDLRKRTIRMTQQGTPFGSKKQSKTQLSDYLDQLPIALDQAIKLYDEQVAVCNSEKWAPEHAEKVLKPLKDRIDLLQNIKKYEMIARPAAAIGDKVITKIGGMIGDI